MWKKLKEPFSGRRGKLAYAEIATLVAAFFWFLVTGDIHAFAGAAGAVFAMGTVLACIDDH